MARFLQMELLILREKGRESVFGAVRVALLFVLIVSSLAHVFGGSRLFLFLSSSVLIL